MLHQITFVGIFYGLGDDLVFYKPAIDIIILKIPVSPAHAGLADVAGDFQKFILIIDFQKLPGDLPAIDLINHIPAVVIAGSVQFHLSVDNVFKRNLRVR